MMSVQKELQTIEPARYERLLDQTSRRQRGYMEKLHQQGAPLDRLLRPVHRWVWGDFDRRVRKLHRVRAMSKATAGAISCAPPKSPRTRCCAGCTWNTRSTSCATPICSVSAAPPFSNCAPTRSTALFDTSPLPGGHGLDDLSIEGEPDHRLLAFLHVAEKAAAGRFAIYRDVVDDDPSTRAIFEEILRDEVFHMNYTYTQLARVLPRSYRRQVWQARASRLWKRYLRRRGGGGRRAGQHDSHDHVFRGARALRVAGQTRRAPRAGRLDAASHTSGNGFADEPVLRLT